VIFSPEIEQLLNATDEERARAEAMLNDLVCPERPPGRDV
jgi:hypothetical protein